MSIQMDQGDGNKWAQWA